MGGNTGTMKTSSVTYSWLVLASPLVAIIANAAYTSSKLEPDAAFLLLCGVAAIIASMLSKHVWESFAIDSVGVTIVAVSGTSPLWYQPVLAEISARVLSFAALAGVDTVALLRGPVAWGLREHATFAVGVTIFYVAIEKFVVYIYGAGDRPPSFLSVFCHINHLITIVSARHLLEFVMTGAGAASTGTKGSFSLPAKLLKVLVTPTWGEMTAVNSVVAFLACIVVYDLFFYAFQAFFAKQVMMGSRQHPVNWFFSSYLQLLSVVTVCLSPTGCHAFAVLGFVFVSVFTDAVYLRRISLEDSMIPFIKTGIAGYGKILSFWDSACHTA